MRIQYGWVLALLLVGCQQLQQTQAITNPNKDKKHSAISLTTEKQPEQTIKKSTPLKPSQAQDMWLRITSQMKMRIPDDPKIQYYRSWYLKHPEHLKTVSERAKPFLYLIATKIEQRNMPLELALLPAVESTFDPSAYSYSSAAGLWQFMPATAKTYNLEQDFWYDGRRDVNAATDAALDYLSDLNKQLDGNWENTIAAYNSGGGRVLRAIKQNQKLGKPTDFFSLDLPKETTGYLPKLLALVDVIKRQKQYGIELADIPNKPAVKLVDPQEQLDLSIAASYAGISTQELQHLNPGYSQWMTAPEGTQKLLLPIHTADRFAINANKNKGKGIYHIRYQVKPGDSISVLAHTYHTSSDAIRTANHLANNTIRINQYLLIPSPAEANMKVKAPQSSQVTQAHTVQEGESLWSIAKKNHVSPKTLAQWNNLTANASLRIGQKLVLHSSRS